MYEFLLAIADLARVVVAMDNVMRRTIIEVWEESPLSKAIKKAPPAGGSRTWTNKYLP